MRFIYSLVLMLLSPFVLLRLWRRGGQVPAYRQRWSERFAFIAAIQGRPIWVHAVSVGETLAAVPLIKHLLSTHPDTPVLVTTTTPTGSEQVKRLFGDQVLHIYMPYDMNGVIKRFLKHVQPRLLVVMETELWPNLFHHCRQQHVPVIVANARMSERSARGYARFAALAASTLNEVAVIAAQSEADAERFIALGAGGDLVQVTGSVKFDISLPDDLIEQGAVLRSELFAQRPVWLAASTHEGEDELVLQAFAEVRLQQPDLLLLLVPRHPERFDAVADLCQSQGYEVVRRSEKRPCSETTALFVGDSMGELLLFLAAADLCYMGGSLVPVGGHNLLEPAAVGVPVVFGPHMFNFAVISQMFLERDAAHQVADTAELAKVVSELFADSRQRSEIALKAKQLLAENRGAQARLEALVDERLRSSV